MQSELPLAALGESGDFTRHFTSAVCIKSIKRVRKGRKKNLSDHRQVADEFCSQSVPGRVDGVGLNNDVRCCALRLMAGAAEIVNLRTPCAA